jgi:DNA repair exonuclease SbcCD ATPase subunit
MKQSTPIISSTAVFDTLLQRLDQLDGELSVWKVNFSDERIDDIVEEVFQALEEATSSLQNISPSFERASLINPFSPLQSQLPRPVLNSQQVRNRLFKTKIYLSDLTRNIRDLSSRLVSQEDAQTFAEINTIFETVRDQIQRDRERTESVARQQEDIQSKVGLLNQQAAALHTLQGECTQLLVQMGHRADQVGTSLSQLAAQSDVNDRRIATNAEEISRMLEQVNAHIEQLSTLEVELQGYTRDVDQHNVEVDETTAAISGLTEEVVRHLEGVSAVQQGYSRLQTSLREVQRTLTEPPPPSSNPAAPAVVPRAQQQVHELSESTKNKHVVAHKLFSWMFHALVWYKEAYDQTSAEVSTAMNGASQYLRPKLASCFGENKAAIITHPKVWVTAGLVILLWKGKLRKAMMCYALVCAVFHTVYKPTKNLSSH